MIRPEYHRIERQWCLWDEDARDAIRDESGAIRLFLTAQGARDWQADEHTNDELAHDLAHQAGETAQ